MLFSQVPSCLFQAPHFGLNVQTTNLTQAVASSFFQNAPTTSSASANPQPQAVFIENKPDHMSQNGDLFVVDSVIDFIKGHSRGGTWPRAHEHAVQTIDVAILFNADAPEKQKLVLKWRKRSIWQSF
jgi:hypothetical protein